MYKRFISVVFLSVGVLLSLNLYAKSNLSCQAPHLETDELLEVKISSGYVGSKIATAQWPGGYPTIVIDDSAFIKLPNNARQFIFYHECAHLKTQTEDERQADCDAIDMLIEQQGYKEIDIRRLVDNLVNEIGLSIRWTSLLECRKR